MRIARKILCVCVMAAILVMAIPVSSLAVDPVSAATMANAFAQAITAYGASQGVSMMFDISNTSQIGEQVHELWKRFRSDQQTADDYETIAATVFPSLYYKAMRAVGAVVGIKLAAEYVAYLDGFWNWLLSGPAEMTKVDDKYYQFSSSQIGSNAIPITVEQNSIAVINGNTVDSFPITVSTSSNYKRYSSSYPGYGYIGYDTNSTSYYFVFFNESTSYPVELFNYNGGNPITSTQYSNAQYGDYYYQLSQLGYANWSYNGDVYSYAGIPYPEYVFGSYDSSSSGLTNISLGVQAYNPDGIVNIPDNTDVNYDPIPADIPLDIPWDDSLYGDGQVLTDTQSIEIADELDLAISNIDTLELAEPIDVPADPPSEVYIPLLPVELPSFNFSLSGIWHYVVSWVQSLGAWLSLMFQTWAVLPSAITIPVYATAVIVIVLGVYKRFFM